MKFDVIVADCPWSFDDKIDMSDVARGAEANYAVLDIKAIKELKVQEVTADNAILALWVPSSLLQEGLDTMKSWGFRQTQTHVWVKTKKSPLEDILDICRERIDSLPGAVGPRLWNKAIKEWLAKATDEFNMNDMLAFGMGRLFRQTHEICLLGVRGKIYDQLKSKSERSVHFATNLKHSAKPEILQDRLDVMFPNALKLEMFARRSRAGWTCVGLECPDSLGADIRDSLEKLSKLP